MEPKLILYPLLAMAALTFIVAVVMFRRRVASMKANRIHPQNVATSGQMSTLIEDSRASDNFRNLFETPMLFYVAMLTIYSTGLICTAHLVFAWAYVLTRCVHSYLQCTANIVMRRFYAFLASGIFLLFTWLMLGYQLVSMN